MLKHKILRTLNNIPEVTCAAKAAGVKHHYLTGENSTSTKQVPQSIKILHTIKKRQQTITQ